MKVTGILAGLILSLVCMGGGASAQSSKNMSASWGNTWAPSSADQLFFRENRALIDHTLNNGGGSNAGGSVTNNYNGTVYNTGPSSSSGSNVTNVQNMNSTSTTATNSTVITSTDQSASGGTQSGSANSNAAMQGAGSGFGTSTNQATTSN